MEHPFEGLAKKEPKSDAELITFLAVTRISHHLPISTVLSLPASELTPERVYDSLLREARTLWEWYQDHVEKRARKRVVSAERTDRETWRPKTESRFS
jgi:hypothetical protein